VFIQDDGNGMSSSPRPDGSPSEIECFFNLGDSYKSYGSIGSKGHGTKIYYKSGGIEVATYKSGKSIRAKTEVPPWETLQKGIVPTYQIEESEAEADRRGTEIKVDGFIAKQSDFTSLEELVRYVKWYTVLGSFGNYFSQPRKMDLTLRPADSSEVSIEFGFVFPESNEDIEAGTAGICKIFGPITLDAGTTEEGAKVTVQIVGALLGEEHRSIVPDTYTHMGLWLCKDFLRIERKDEVLERAFGGQYYYRSFLLLANCQQFDLTANRNNIRVDQEEYDLAISAIARFCESIRDDKFTVSYFEKNKQEQSDAQKAKELTEQELKKKTASEKRKARMNTYVARENLDTEKLVSGPVKVPQNEIEVAILLQAMISSKH
jgi:hypothetical protein